MKKNFLSILIGVILGIPICVYAEKTRPEQRDLLERPATESYIVELPQLAEEENIEEIADQDFQADLQLLACLVQAEAGNQDMTGKRLIVDVVLNRVADPRFPNTISEVIYQPGQFSPVTDGSLAKAYYTVTQDCFEAVAEELNDQIDYSIHFFCAGGYGCGVPAYRYGDHYFSK